MPKTDNKNYPFSFHLIDIKKIDPSLYQHRSFFDENNLKKLGAIKNYTDLTQIQAKIIVVDDLQARRISAAENILRQDLSALESIEATINIIDVEMGKDPWYLTAGKTPLERVDKLLSKLHSIRVSKDRGSLVSKEAEVLLNKFIQQVDAIFNNLPKPLK
ncbi:hypothetical protein [Desulfobacula sp.]